MVFDTLTLQAEIPRFENLKMFYLWMGYFMLSWGWGNIIFEINIMYLSFQIFGYKLSFSNSMIACSFEKSSGFILNLKKLF